MEALLVIFFSYFSGSIPFGFILTKIFSKTDIRKIGSGNIGTTNVLRTGNKFLALITLILDISKGYLPVMISMKYFPDLIQLSCLSTFLGSVLPIWLKFKGGKGVATYLGIILALSYSFGFLFIFTWVVVSLIFKYSSISSIFASITVFIITLIKNTVIESIQSLNTVIDAKLILFIFCVLIIFTHRQNIIRLKNGTELKIKL